MSNTIYDNISRDKFNYDADLNYDDVNALVVADLKSQNAIGNSPLSDEDYDLLYNNLHIWKNELIRLKQNVEMHLTNTKHALFTVKLKLRENPSLIERKRLNREITEMSSKRIHSLKFLQSVELRLLDVKEYIVEETKKLK